MSDSFEEENEDQVEESKTGNEQSSAQVEGGVSSYGLRSPAHVDVQMESENDEEDITQERQQEL